VVLATKSEAIACSGPRWRKCRSKPPAQLEAKTILEEACKEAHPYWMVNQYFYTGE